MDDAGIRSYLPGPFPPWRAGVAPSLRPALSFATLLMPLPAPSAGFWANWVSSTGVWEMYVKRAVVEKDLDVVISGVVVGCYFWKLSLVVVVGSKLSTFLIPKIDSWNALATRKIGIKKGSKQHPKSTLMLLSPVNIIGAFSFLVNGIPDSHLFQWKQKNRSKVMGNGNQNRGVNVFIDDLILSWYSFTSW